MSTFEYYAKWLRLMNKYEKLGDNVNAAHCFGQLARLSALYIYPKEWRVMYYSDMKPIILPK